MNINNLKFDSVKAIYFFGDIRGYSTWSKKNQPEVDKLISIYYSLALETFNNNKGRIIKFAGDGFLGVSEYIDNEDNQSFLSSLEYVIQKTIEFNKKFLSSMFYSILHDNDCLTMGYGISYGHSFKYAYDNYLDYVGEKVNFASRLVSKANGNQILLEKDIAGILYAVLTKNQIPLEYKYKRIELKDYDNNEVVYLDLPSERFENDITKQFIFSITSKYTK